MLPATAFIPAKLFREFCFDSPGLENPQHEMATFEVSIDAMLQCLNIFGSAGSAGAPSVTTSLRMKRGRMAGELEEGALGFDDEGPRRGSGKERRTGMRMTWAGEGEPLCMILSVGILRH